MKITPRVALEIAQHEALVRSTYVDSVGVNTWSVGITSRSGFDVDKFIGRPQPLESCLEIYVRMLEKYAGDVHDAFRGFRLSEAQFCAALSFQWNTGGINRAVWVDKWQAGDIDGARKAFLNWRSPPEIIERRKKERDLFFDGTWGKSRTTIPEIRKLTKARRPIWSSMVQTECYSILESLLDPQPPADYVPPDPPSKTPIGIGIASSVALVVAVVVGFWQDVLEFIQGIF